jgi:hypothetical protein
MNPHCAASCDPCLVKFGPDAGSDRVGGESQTELVFSGTLSIRSGQVNKC